MLCGLLQLAQSDAALFFVGGQQGAVRLADGVDEVAGSGHQHIHLGADPVGIAGEPGEFRAGGILHPPVGDDAAIKAPFVPEDGFYQLVMIVAPDTVDLVVAGHQGQRLSFLHADLKTLQVNFPQGPLREDTVVLVPVGLLIVAGKVLGTGGHTGALDAPDVGGSDAARNQRIFRVVFKITAAEGIAVDVHAGSQLKKNFSI